MPLRVYDPALSDETAGEPVSLVQQAAQPVTDSAQDRPVMAARGIIFAIFISVPFWALFAAVAYWLL